jgi:hypothetical protein
LSKKNKAKKSATNNQWTSTSQDKSNSSERRDGPGGENAK